MLMAELEPGQKARVIGVGKKPQAARRLFEMGIIPGSEVEVLSRHPFKGPYVLKVGNGVLAIGRSIAQNIEVEAI